MDAIKPITIVARAMMMVFFMYSTEFNLGKDFDEIAPDPMLMAGKSEEYR